MKARSLRVSTVIRSLRVILLVSIAVLVLGNCIVFIVRGNSLLECYPFFITEGCEGPHIYAMWRLQHGHRLYEWPHSGLYSVTFYNFGFYWLYATTLRIIGALDERILLYGRALTIAFGLAGAAIQCLIIREGWPQAFSQLSTRATAVAVSLVVWLGTNFAGWWPLSLRPDMPAAMFESLGVLLYLRAARRQSVVLLLAASASCFMAWSIKQSAVFAIVGIFGYEILFVRRWLRLAALAIPMALGVFVSLVIGGDVYIYNIVYVPSVSSYNWMPVAEIFGRVLSQNVVVWVGPILLVYCIYVGIGRASREGSRGSWIARLLMESSGCERVVLAVYVTAFPLGLLALGRVGSNKNHLFLAYAMASVLTIGAWSRSRLLEPRRQVYVLGLFCVFMLPCAAFPLVQLYLPNQVGRIRLATESEIDDKQKLVNFVRQAAKPVFVVDDILSLPWNSNSNTYPAFVLDDLYFQIASSKGLIKDGGLESLIRKRQFATLLLRDGDLQRVATESGYTVVARFESVTGGAWTVYALTGVGALEAR